jgi:hypothetical protein
LDIHPEPWGMSSCRCLMLFGASKSWRFEWQILDNKHRKATAGHWMMVDSCWFLFLEAKIIKKHQKSTATGCKSWGTSSKICVKSPRLRLGWYTNGLPRWGNWTITCDGPKHPMHDVFAFLFLWVQHVFIPDV